MIGYYLNPFVAPDDNQVLASISADISRQDNVNAIAYAPHQFQVWQLGEINDEGIIKPHKELICDVHTLVRARREPAKQGDTQAPSPVGNSTQRVNGLGGTTGAGSEALPKS